jgi:uncharacterized BrkB/YihY/UPF0761 family membrane protein
MSDESIRVQTLKTMTTLITTAFALVAGLAWNAAIQALIKEFIPTGGAAVVSMITYAIIVTIIAVIVTVLFARTMEKLGIDMDKDK